MRNVAIMVTGLLAALPAFAQQGVTSVVIPDQAPYSNVELINTAVVNECDLPHRVIDQLKVALSKNGIQGTVRAAPKPIDGDNVLLLAIANAESGRRGFGGHNKFVTVTGTLYQKGQEVAHFVDSRGSMGGAFAEFKSSCSVLGRCTASIGEDVAHWLKSPVDGAKLGDAR